MVKLRQKTTKTKAKTKKKEVQKEMTRLGAALRGLGGLGGGAIGSMFGAAGTGSSVGTSLGAALSRWLGSGDYSVTTNSVVQRTLKGSESIPAMHSQNQTVVVRHKEYLGEIRGSTGFSVQQVYSLNPGVGYSFPWLSNIAAQFSEYKFKGVVFHYIPTSGTTVNGTNPAIGSVMMQTTYRATDVAPTSKIEMLNEYWACEAAPNESFCHPIECSPKENPFAIQYVRTGSLPATETPLLYDLGTTFIATSGQPASGNVIGDLWVTYEVELRKPVVSSNVSTLSESFYASTNSYTPTNVNWFGTTASTSGQLGCTISGNTLTFPKGAAGFWLITVRLAGAFTALDLSGAPAYSNAAGVFVNPTSASPVIYTRTVLSAGAGSLASGYYQCGIWITDPQVQATVGFPSATSTGTFASAECSVARTL